MSLTINRRWLAREWLVLLAGMLWAFLVWPILLGFLPWYVRGDRALAYGPYVVLQIIRVTKWAIADVARIRSNGHVKKESLEGV